ncbi:MAG: oligosaccharide flippase family protein [Acidobacteria bacterium]|nr:oligosaccharide flippase family protein [Acidobacteriota bacterium]
MKKEKDIQSLKAQSVWLLTAKIIGFALSFFLPLVIVRSLSQEAVGHYREAFLVIMNAVIILPLGLSMSAYYFLARETERRGAAIFNILLFNFVVGGLACLFLFIYPESIGNIFRSEELTRLAPKIGIVIWIWIFATFLETVAIANQEARVATVFIILAQLSKTLLMGGAVLIFATVEAFIWAAMIQGVIQTAVLIYYLRTRFPGFWRGKEGNKEEMIRLTARAMQKLAFVYFPIYAFLLVTSQTFIITLFTEKYAASASVFAINLTLLPLGVMITDPIVRSYKELGRFFLVTRIIVLAGVVAVLYIGLGSFSMTGIISVAVGAIILEKIIAETMVVRKLGLGLRHLAMMKNVGKAAVISLVAGVVTYLVYSNVHEYLRVVGQHFAEETFHTSDLGAVNFVGGSLVLLISGLVFAPIYLIGANLWGLIEDSERNAVRSILRKFLPLRTVEPATDTRG